MGKEGEKREKKNSRRKYKKRSRFKVLFRGGILTRPKKQKERRTVASGGEGGRDRRGSLFSMKKRKLHSVKEEYRVETVMGNNSHLRPGKGRKSCKAEFGDEKAGESWR